MQDGGPTDISRFLWEMRRIVTKGTEGLERLAGQRDAAAQRMSDLRARIPTELVEELRLRDEELCTIAGELTQLLDAARHAGVLLERERSKYIDLFEHDPDAHIVTNLGGTIDEANSAAGALFRTEADFLRGRSLITFVARGDTDAFRSLLRRLQSGDQAAARDPTQAALRMRPRGQSVFVAYIHVGVLSGTDGRPLALRWVMRRLNREKGADGTGEALAELAGSLADDLRGQLVAIMDWARCLREWDVRDEEERRKALGWIERGAHEPRATLDELAEFARVYREAPEAQTIDVREAVEQCARAAEEWSRLVVRFDEAVHGVSVLASGFSRAFELFTRRALEGTPRQANVDLQVRLHAADVVIDVVAPEGARIPDGWSIRTATAARIIERSAGRVALASGSPSVRLRLARLPG
jgi:PAS domain S-box-containing protein